MFSDFVRRKSPGLTNREATWVSGYGKYPHGIAVLYLPQYIQNTCRYKITIRIGALRDTFHKMKKLRQKYTWFSFKQ